MGFHCSLCECSQKFIPSSINTVITFHYLWADSYCLSSYEIKVSSKHNSLVCSVSKTFSGNFFNASCTICADMNLGGEVLQQKWTETSFPWRLLIKASHKTNQYLHSHLFLVSLEVVLRVKITLESEHFKMCNLAFYTWKSLLRQLY